MQGRRSAVNRCNCSQFFRVVDGLVGDRGSFQRPDLPQNLTDHPPLHGLPPVQPDAGAGHDGDGEGLESLGRVVALLEQGFASAMLTHPARGQVTERDLRDQFLPAYEAMQVNGTAWNGLPGGRAEAIMCSVSAQTAFCPLRFRCVARGHQHSALREGQRAY